jgi:hypothetical protein
MIYISNGMAIFLVPRPGGAACYVSKMLHNEGLSFPCVDPKLEV